MIQTNHQYGQFECDPLFLCYSDDWQTEPETEWVDIFREMAIMFERVEVRQCVCMHIGAILTSFSSS